MKYSQFDVFFFFFEKVCVRMLNSFREAYEETLVLMRENKKEVVWNFSPSYVFGLAEMFLARLKKVKNLFDCIIPKVKSRPCLILQDTKCDRDEREILCAVESIHQWDRNVRQTNFIDA